MDIYLNCYFMRSFVTRRMLTMCVVIGCITGGVNVANAESGTVAELQDRIRDLQEKLAELQQEESGMQESGMAMPASVGEGCGSEFTRDLAVGARGSQVRQLQVFLNSPVVYGVQVAASGAGSPGQETSYFGSRTAQAVTTFQNRYPEDVLAPVGLSRGTGYWGPSSRAKANELCGGGSRTEGE